MKHGVYDTNLSPVASSSCSRSQVSFHAASCDETETQWYRHQHQTVQMHSSTITPLQMWQDM